MTYLRILSLALALRAVSPAGAQTSSIDATQPASGSSLASSPVRNNFGSAKTEIQELMDRDADTTQVSEIVVYSSTDAEKVGSDACSIATAGTAALTCTAGINAGITDASAAALAATQGGAGPSIYAFGGPVQVVDGTSAGGQVQIFEGSSNGSNYVEFVAPAALSVTNTITFDSSGLIPVAEVSGALTGPGSSTSAAIPTWNGTGGTALNTQSNWTISSGVLTGSSSRISMSGSTSGSTALIAGTQTSTGLIAKFAKGSAYTQVDNNGELEVSASSADPATAITQLGDGDAINVLQSGAVGNIASMVNGSGEGMAIGNGGISVFAATDSTNEPVTISQGGTGPMLEVLDATSGGKFAVLNGGGSSVTNDASSSQAAFTITQSHSSAAILDAEGFDIASDSSVDLVVSSSINPVMEVVQQSTGPIATFSDSGSGGVFTIANGGYVTVSNDSGSPTLSLSVQTSGDDPTLATLQKRTTTTTATTTTAASITPVTNGVCFVETITTAVCTGGSGCTANQDGYAAKKAAAFRTVAGVITQIGSTTTIMDEASAGASTWSQTFTAPGDATFLVEVSGEVNDNITWHTHTTYSCLAS